MAMKLPLQLLGEAQPTWSFPLHTGVWCWVPEKTRTWRGRLRAAVLRLGNDARRSLASRLDTSLGRKFLRAGAAEQPIAVAQRDKCRLEMRCRQPGSLPIRTGLCWALRAGNRWLSAGRSPGREARVPAGINPAALDLAHVALTPSLMHLPCPGSAAWASPPRGLGCLQPGPSTRLRLAGQGLCRAALDCSSKASCLDRVGCQWAAKCRRVNIKHMLTLLHLM